MARKKKTVSKVLDKASARLASIRSIDPELDMGNGNSITDFDAAITVAEGELEDYNTQLSQVDDFYDKFQKREKSIAEYSRKMLNAVGSKYGYDSIEYEKAGGVPTSKRKKPKKPDAAA